MTYSKPELLAVEAALHSIRGEKMEPFAPDSDQTERQTAGAYDVDE